MRSLTYRATRRATAYAAGLAALATEAAESVLRRAYACWGYARRPDDLFVVTYPKSGSTLMQMMMYQLTTDGSMDVEHVGPLVPWFEVYAVKNPRYLQTLPSPRVFKTHLQYSLVPRGPRVIYVVRNVRDVAVSYYHHAVSQVGYPGSLEEFVGNFVRGRVWWGSWYRHLASWWPHRHDDGVLFLRYEDVIQDLRGTAGRVARFANLDASPERLDRAAERCRIDFMRRHTLKFDPRLEMYSRPRGAGAPFVRAGRTGGWTETLDPRTAERLGEGLRQMASVLGLDDPEDYESLVSGRRVDRRRIGGSAVRRFAGARP